MNGGLGNLGVSLVQLLLGNVLMVYGIGDAAGIAGTFIPQGGWFLFPCCLVRQGSNSPKYVKIIYTEQIGLQK